MTPQELRGRLDRFADGVIGLCRGVVADLLSSRLLIQLQDAATSAAANYAGACRAQTRAGFVAKLSVALEECDEARGWLRHLASHRIGDEQTVSALLQEATELTAILAASRRTAQRRPAGKR